MITIQLPNGILDVYKQEISLQWSTIRFSDGLKDAYSTDFRIPKNHNNISLLDASGLLDSPNQLFGTQIKPAVLLNGGSPIDIYIQVVRITDNDIELCIYEKMINDELMGKSLRGILTDYTATIREWNKNSISDNNAIFYKYEYGSPYDKKWAQCHGSINLRQLIERINQQYHTDLPLTGIMSYWRTVANGKNVCPQNTVQMIEGRYDRLADSNVRNQFVMMGGQHIVNDLEGYEKTTERRAVTFNRNCAVQFNMYFSWMCNTSYGTYRVYMKVNGQTKRTYSITVPSGSQASGVQTWTQDAINFRAGDVLTFERDSGFFPLEDCAFVMECDITNYPINAEDYGTDLRYCARPARLPLFEWYNQQGIHEKDGLFDGQPHTYLSWNNGTHPVTVTFPKRSLSYFGIYCNLPDITVKEFYSSLCWLKGYKAVFRDNRMTLVQANERLDLDGEITYISPVSNHIGKRNYIRYDGDETGTPVSVIDSVWLDDEKDIHVSHFLYTPRSGQNGCLTVEQYDIIPSEDSNVDYSVTFTDVDGMVIGQETGYNGTNMLTPMANLNTMGFEAITSVIEVEFETYDDRAKDLDYIEYQGRKYMVIEGETDMATGLTTMTMLLVPTT